ncbi:metallophosphoesterase [Erysipelothrix sp. HDW6C]|uniref:metallophosphoesterase n=1 Tax=Erysipelothrix sp. HDW6C TaxID=2714930 RepID=UPI00140C495E|nr:metallophosphoesterase [Erysipelothrix sp. HDW6C]QIK69332.1 metallophosphoesterase [Erysipelothrix sp. HDW6C]
MKRLLLILLATILVGCTQKPADHVATIDTNIQTDIKDLRIVFASDLHYLSPELITEGAFFESSVRKGDGKMLLDMELITDAFINNMLALKPNAVVLTGDITLNGERKSHEDLAAKLNILTDAGIQVLVTAGNHDLNNPNARRYNEDSVSKVESVDSLTFARIYENQGFAPSNPMDKDSLSYVAPLSKDVWLFMMEANTGDLLSGELSDETYAWLEGQLIEAKKNNITPLFAMHHNIMNHSQLIYEGFTVNNAPRLRKLLIEYNVKLAFSGHIHTQSISKTSEGELYDIASGALSVYPLQFGVLDIDQDLNANYKTQSINTGVEGFDKKAETFFYELAFDKRLRGWDTEYFTEAEKEEVAHTFALLNLEYFAGRAITDPEYFRNLTGYKLVVEREFEMTLEYFDSILEETRDSRQLSINLKQ